MAYLFPYSPIYPGYLSSATLPNTTTTFIDSPLNPLSVSSITAGLSDSLTTTVVTETSTSPIVSTSLGMIGSETSVRHVASNTNYITLPPFSPIVDIVDSPIDSVVVSPVISPVLRPGAITSINLNYSKPLIATYNDLNSDYDTHQTIIKYVRTKMLDKWLYHDFKDIFGYLKVHDGKVSLASSVDKKAYKKDSDKDLELKVDYIGNNFLTKKVVEKLMYKYIKESGSEWVKVPHAEYYVKQMLYHKLKKMLKEKL